MNSSIYAPLIPSCIIPTTDSSKEDKTEYINCRINAIRYHLVELSSYLEKEHHTLAARNARIAAFDLVTITNSLGIKTPT